MLARRVRSQPRAGGPEADRLYPEGGGPGGSEVERVKEAEERREVRVAEAALDLAEVCLADAGACGQLALAELKHSTPHTQRPHDS
jgi:hypothetical protein